jgi:hypothetical protein
MSSSAALRALEQDALAGAARLGQHLPDRGGIGQDLRRDLQDLRQQRLAVDRVRPRPARSALWWVSRRSTRDSSVASSDRSATRMARRPTLSS